MDIEFIVQYYVLQYAYEHPDLIGPRNNMELIGMLHRIDLMAQSDGRALADAYYCYLKAEHHSKLAEQTLRIASNELKEHREHVKMLWHRLFD